MSVCNRHNEKVELESKGCGIPEQIKQWAYARPIHRTYLAMLALRESCNWTVEDIAVSFGYARGQVSRILRALPAKVHDGALVASRHQVSEQIKSLDQVMTRLEEMRQALQHPVCCDEEDATVEMFRILFESGVESMHHTEIAQQAGVPEKLGHRLIQCNPTLFIPTADGHYKVNC